MLSMTALLCLQEAQLPQKDTVKLVNSFYASRAMGVMKVSNSKSDIQHH